MSNDVSDGLARIITAFEDGRLFASLGYHQPPTYPEPGLHEWWEEGFYAAIAAGEAAPSLYSTLGDSAEAAAPRPPARTFLISSSLARPGEHLMR